MRVSFGTRSPQALRFSARSEGVGSGLHTGHCFARPDLPRCAWPEQGRRASFVGSAQRVTDTRRSCEAAAVLDPASTPSGCAEKRRAWGGCVCRRTHALRDLTRRGCLSGVRRTKRVPRRHPRTEHRRLPEAKRRDADSGVAFSLVTFSWRRKRKLLRRRAHIPASAPNQGMQQGRGTEPRLQLQSLRIPRHLQIPLPHHSAITHQLRQPFPVNSPR